MQYAKQLYLYGEGSTKPVKNTKTLAKLAGVSERGIRDHIAEWRQTSSELALNNPNSPYSLALSEEVLIQHRDEIDFLGNEVKTLREEVKKWSRDKTQNYYVALQAYQTALTKWEKSSGLLAHYNTAEAAMKERARAHERAKGKQGDTPKVKRKVDRSRFAD